ncbi:MAG: two-component sensor histidine kinase [Sulfurimonas sp.]|jgi:two-component sensor histidine kinase|uniref:7TM diverse intracellular signaling domain-containing protein n=1 Tax=Sulfurimonas sp. TaxID=2022749 RepID=UPI0039E28B4D
MTKYLLTLIMFVSTLFSDSSIVVNDDDYLYDKFTISYDKDFSSSLSIEEIAKQTFSKTSTNNFTLGYTEEDAWFKFSIHNKSKDESFILSLNENYYDVANLYYFDERWIKKENGVFTPIEQRDVKSNKLAFELKILPNQKRTFYLKINSKNTYFGKLTLEKKNFYYYNHEISMNTLFIYIFGILTIIITFNLFLYISLRENIYIYYVGYSFFYLIYLINLSGLLAYVGLQQYIYDLSFAVAFVMGFLVLFSIEYLEVKTYLSKYYKILKLLSVPFFILGVLVVFSYQPWNKIMNNLAGLINIVLIIVSIIIYIKGHHKAKYYIFALTLYFTSIIIFTLTIKGNLEYSYFTRYGFVVASMFEMIIFSLMLANRYNEMKNETISSQIALIELKDNHQKYLEKEVHDRTDTIEKLLGEKELLIKELYHRVKNNFHMIIGLLWIEEDNAKEKVLKDSYLKMISRINSMSTVHKYLYESDTFAEIDSKKYMSEIIYEIKNIYSNKTISINENVESFLIDIDSATQLSMIINELLNNSIKHHKKDEVCVIDIILTQKGNLVRFSLEDNGLGFDDKKKSNGLGLKLVKQFSKKLSQADYGFSFNDGTKFELSFFANLAK